VPGSGDNGQVHLTADSGAGAADPDQFFRSPEFYRAEGVTHSLRLGDDGPVLPLLVREIPDSDLLDAVSPYGYPGASRLSPDPIDPARLDWSHTELVSIFVRDAIGPAPVFAGATERSRVQVSDPALPAGMRKRLREQIRRNYRKGWETQVTPGPEVTPLQLAGFSRAYAETMSRTEASDRYLFADVYFETLLESPTAWLVTAANHGEVLAGAIAVRSDGLLHYFLGGTAEEGLTDSPMKNLFATMIDLSQESGLPLNLGGGVSPGDSLDQFKRGFANSELPFFTHEVICAPERYHELSSRSTADPPVGFFPAYRAD